MCLVYKVRFVNVKGAVISCFNTIAAIAAKIGVSCRIKRSHGWTYAILARFFNFEQSIRGLCQ